MARKRNLEVDTSKYELTVFLATYTPEEYEKLLLVADDTDDLEPLWEDWRREVQKVVGSLLAQNMKYVEVPIKVDKLAQFCLENNLPNNSETRSKFAMYLGKKQKQPEQITADIPLIIDADPVHENDDDTIHSYPEPLDKLLTYGTPESVDVENWPDYLAPGITKEHIPALLRMIADPGLRTSDPKEDDPKYWAAVHAWRTLGQLRDASAVESLLQQTEDLFDDTTGFGDWAIEELPDIYEAIGPVAIPILTRCIADPSWPVNTRINAMTGLTKITTKYPEHRDETVIFLTEQLEDFAQNDPEINGYLIANLTELKAVETLPIIQKAFVDGNVDTFLIDLKYVEEEFGLRERPEPAFTDLNSFLQKLSQSQGQEDATSVSQAPPQPHVHKNFPPTRSSSPPRGGKSKVTKKAKAKMEKKSRKKNLGK